MKNTPMPLEELPALPRDNDGPVFNQPWEAKAFALALRLSEVGCFSWPEWVKIFSQEIKTAQDRGDPDLGDTYYRHWLNALERICAAKGLVGGEDMDRRKAAWQRAYLNTPHGRPIELAAAFKPDSPAALKYRKIS
jgi:nitrile hydratase accessory protein